MRDNVREDTKILESDLSRGAPGKKRGSRWSVLHGIGGFVAMIEIALAECFGNKMEAVIGSPELPEE